MDGLHGNMVHRQRRDVRKKKEEKGLRSVERRDFAFSLRVGIRYKLHIMRHTFGSLRAQAGRSIFKIAQWMGDSVRTTERHYAKLAPSDPDIEV